MNGLFDGSHIGSGIGLRDDGQQKDAYGVGDRAGKEDQGQGHPGENPVNAQGCGVVITVGHQPVGDKNSLHALKEIDDYPV